MENKYSTNDDEKYVISCLLNNDADVIDSYPLKPEMFKNEFCAAAYKQIDFFREHNRDYDVVTLMDAVARYTNTAKEYLNDFFMDLLSMFTLSINYKAHAEMIKKSYIADKIVKLVNTTEIDVENIDKTLNNLSTGIDEINDIETTKIETISDITSQYFDDYFKPGIENIDIGFSGIDATLDKGDMIVIGARPAVGKSAFATQVCYYWAKKGLKVAYFNLEMKEKQVFERFISFESGIGITRLKKAESYRNDERERYQKAVESLKKMENIFVLSGTRNTKQIRSDVRTIKPDIVVIDYLQLVKPTKAYSNNRYAEVGQISHDLKNIAMDFNIPLVCLTQLNRMSEKTETKEPTMADIRESGDIEQDASVILMLWNKSDENKNLKGFKVEKNRQGNLSKTELLFDGNMMRFKEMNDFNKYKEKQKEDTQKAADKFVKFADVEDMPFL